MENTVEAQLRRELEQERSDAKSEAGVEGGGRMGVRVLDLTRVLAGPFCTMLLADMGADVIKLELPGIGDDARQFPPFKDGVSLYYVNLNRGKRSITLNLKNAEGKKVFLDLVRKCDVVIENFSPGTMDRIGLGYEKLKEVNPRIVYAAISGFGQTGRYKSRPGYDIISQAMSGLMSITGWPDSPPTRAGTAIGDMTCALFTCVGVLSALQVRRTTGQGQLVDVALVDSLFTTMSQHVQKIFIEDAVPSRIGNRYEFIAPYDSFKAADGWVIIAVANDAIWQRFVACTAGALGMATEIADPTFNTNPKRLENHAQLKVLVEGWTSQHKIEDIVTLLLENRIPACPIKELADVANDQHVAHDRKMIVEVEQPEIGTVKLMGNPVKMSHTNPCPRGPAPVLGQHNSEVLRELLGLSADAIAALKQQGVFD
ncbi:Lcarnitine dehydratase/bile acid-inducible protein F, putative [Acanthamoeba castellanii str. Neff]|uniref:Lcarnitine dehydratase/bile acid-inducible protein F, putative n=1 Tax=Acanthamoeba castellanii (strain ATCC 30010 / Neff) TaxID=1257118 RepID=L8H915_ACACF|nr:Lcarnitine dehydratase/bile acid-inducible protein F, putative [Acanthamoeba castellanii str. Neff]ELR20946.1 Lcarnitine dehydratase/bile acid-inducible protein F, putative [Acanthamoeba castellanii str. Neff]